MPQFYTKLVYTDTLSIFSQKEIQNNFLQGYSADATNEKLKKQPSIVAQKYSAKETWCWLI